MTEWFLANPDVIGFLHWPGEERKFHSSILTSDIACLLTWTQTKVNFVTRKRLFNPYEMASGNTYYCERHMIVKDV